MAGGGHEASGPTPLATPPHPTAPTPRRAPTHPPTRGPPLRALAHSCVQAATDTPQSQSLGLGRWAISTSAFYGGAYPGSGGEPLPPHLAAALQQQAQAGGGGGGGGAMGGPPIDPGAAAYMHLAPVSGGQAMGYSPHALLQQHQDMARAIEATRRSRGSLPSGAPGRASGSLPAAPGGPRGLGPLGPGGVFLFPRSHLGPPGGGGGGGPPGGGGVGLSANARSSLSRPGYSSILPQLEPVPGDTFTVEPRCLRLILGLILGRNWSMEYLRPKEGETGLKLAATSPTRKHVINTKKCTKKYCADETSTVESHCFRAGRRIHVLNQSALSSFCVLGTFLPALGLFGPELFLNSIRIGDKILLYRIAPAQHNN